MQLDRILDDSIDYSFRVSKQRSSYVHAHIVAHRLVGGDSDVEVTFLRAPFKHPLSKPSLLTTTAHKLSDIGDVGSLG